jgi:hypothetical protein
MNQALQDLATEVALADPRNERLRFEFGHACASRVRHLLEDSQVDDCVTRLGAYLAGHVKRDDLHAIAKRAAELANRHQGSKSIDGCGHAAVSATYAVAKALAARALEAADYAAYALVYAQGGYAAVAEQASFEAEFRWQIAALRSLAVQQR